MPDSIHRHESLRLNPLLPCTISTTPIVCQLCGARNIVLVCLDCARTSVYTTIHPEALNSMPLAQPATRFPTVSQPPDSQIFQPTTHQETAIDRNQTPTGNPADGLWPSCRELQMSHQAQLDAAQFRHQAQLDALQFRHQAQLDTLELCHLTQLDALLFRHQAQLDALRSHYQAPPQDRWLRSQRRQPYQRCADGLANIPGALLQQVNTTIPPNCHSAAMPSQWLNGVSNASASQTVPQYQQNPPAESKDNMAAESSSNATTHSSRHPANNVADSSQYGNPLPSATEEADEIPLSFERLHSTVPLFDSTIQDPSLEERSVISPI